jgi:hypothetical protein
MRLYVCMSIFLWIVGNVFAQTFSGKVLDVG